MTGTQLYSIYTDTTVSWAMDSSYADWIEYDMVFFQGIESFKGESSSHRRPSSFISSMKIVFGSQVGLTWFNPFSKPVYLITQNDERVTFDV